MSPCAQTNSLTFIVLDQCGNSNSCTQTVTILNAVTLYPTSVTIPPGSPVPANPPGFSAGCCSNVILTAIGSVTNLTGCGEIIDQVWQAVDCCSNTYLCTNIVTVQPDLPQVVCASNKTVAANGCSAGGAAMSGLTVLTNFPNSMADGSNPSAPLLLASDGLLYGTANVGGSSQEGAVFRLNTDGTGFQLLKSFLGPDGGFPLGGLVEGSNGLLFGTTSAGYGAGTLFTMSKDGTFFTNLHYFGISTDGEEPQTGLVIGTDGALYGTTFAGGVHYAGTVFKIFQDGSGYNAIYHFGSTVGDGTFAGPAASLVLGINGVLYGTASQGGSNGAGMVFKLNQDGSGYADLYSFGHVANDGVAPKASLVFGSDGALYGTTSAGGSSSNGTLFKINPDGTGYASFYSFGSTGTDGTDPLAGLVAGCDGALYGTTAQGGSNNLGTVFKVDVGGSDYLGLWSFSGSAGSSPQAALVAGAGGALYGTTANGDTNGNGNVLRDFCRPGLVF